MNTDKKIRVCAIDIARVNFAFYSEEIPLSKIIELQQDYNSLPKKYQKKTFSSFLPDEVATIFNKLFLSCNRIEGGMGVFDIRDDKTSKELDIKTRINLHILLDSYMWLFDTCDVILIEKQFCSTGGKNMNINIDALKIEEATLNWFLLKYGGFKEVISFPSLFKTHTLACPPKLNKNERKKWSISKGTEILNFRGDTKGIEEINSKKNSKGTKQKKDDIYDSLLMCTTFIYLKLIADNL